MVRFIYILVIGFYFLLSGCIKNNPMPTWIKVSKFTLVDNPDINEGELTENITDGWIYINDKFVGIFELPCKIPVLYSGSDMKISVYPTVRMNGIHETKQQHPYLEGYYVNKDLHENDTTFINPITRYTSNTEFWIEDFQAGSIKLINGTDNLANIVLTNDPLVPNNRYGKITLTPEINTWSVYTADAMVYTRGARVIMEFDYCNTTGISARVNAGKIDGTITEHYFVLVNKQDKDNLVWKKIYLDFTETVNLSGGYKFWHALKSYVNSDSASDVVMIDNIKLIYR